MVRTVRMASNPVVPGAGRPGATAVPEPAVPEPAAPALAVPSPGRAGGFVTVQFVVAVAFSLLLFVMLCNAVVYQYGRGVIRAALDEGVRSGSRASGSTGTCEAAAEEVRHSLLGGPIGTHVALRCGVVAGQVRATATGYLPSWLPLVPDWSVNLSASAVKEPFSAPPLTTATTLPGPGAAPGAAPGSGPAPGSAPVPGSAGASP